MEKRCYFGLIKLAFNWAYLNLFMTTVADLLPPQGMGLVQSFNLSLFLTQILLAVWIVSNKMEFKLILMNLILDCRSLLGQPWKVTIRHILREANLLTLFFGTLWTSLVTTSHHLCRYYPLWGLIPLTILFSLKAHSSGGKDLTRPCVWGPHFRFGHGSDTICNDPISFV